MDLKKLEEEYRALDEIWKNEKGSLRMRKQLKVNSKKHVMNLNLHVVKEI